MTQEVGAAQGTQQISYAKMSERSPQVALALLMMDMAELNKTNAQGKIGEIEQAQNQKKECSEILNMARKYQQDGWHENTKGIPDGIDPKLKQYFKDHGITVPGGKDIEGNYDKVHAAWDTAIAQLQTHLDTIGGNTQTQMVQLQDIMGQYNSEVQGANSAIAQANQVLTAVAKGG